MRLDVSLPAAWFRTAWACVFIALCAAQFAAAEPRQATNKTVEWLLREAYAHDCAGAVMLREAALQQALAIDANDPRVRAWLGYVRQGREWVRFDELPAD